MMLSVVGGVIPASGTVEITTTGTPFRPNIYEHPGVHKGSIDGVRGEILPRASDSDPMLFQRETAGTAVTVSAPAAWVSDDAVTYRDWINIIWVGRNSYTTDLTTTNVGNCAAARSVAAMVGNIKSHVKRFIIMPVINGLNEGSGTSNYQLFRAFEDYLAATYPDNFLNIRRALIDEGLQLAGVTSPTSQDIADKNADTIPASLRVDYIHLTSEAYKNVVGAKLAQFITNKGWMK
jgi:hypothetical protein